MGRTSTSTSTSTGLICTYVGQTSCRPSSPETQRWWSPTCDQQDVNKIKKMNIYKILVIDRILKRYFFLNITKTLIITSSMLCISWTVSMLFAFKCLRKALRDHLWPWYDKNIHSFVKYFLVKNRFLTIPLRKWPGHRGQDHCSWCSLQEKWSQSPFLNDQNLITSIYKHRQKIVRCRKTWMIFVDGVVAEVHARVPQILSSVIVLHCGEPEIICEAKTPSLELRTWNTQNSPDESFLI